MKKLKKLTLKEMEIGMNIIGNRGLQEIRGGDNPQGWTFDNYESYIKDQFRDYYQTIINSIGSALDAAADYFEDREEAFSNLSWSTVESSVTDWLNNLAGGASPLAAPVIIINNPALYGSQSYGSDES